MVSIGVGQNCLDTYNPEVKIISAMSVSRQTMLGQCVIQQLDSLVTWNRVSDKGWQIFHNVLLPLPNPGVG